jgi:voltage-gated potassium channel
MSMLKFFREYNHFLTPLYVLTTLIISGVVGYLFIEDYTLLDAFYMTIHTIATVGYGEIRPLSDAGKIFTSILIITSFGTFAYAISTITRYVADGEFNVFFKNKRLNAAIDKLQDHVIICGYGRNGRQAAHILKKHSKRFVVVEMDSKITDTVSHKYSELVLSGDATQDEVLLEAGIMKASSLITTLPTDADNLFIVITARYLNPTLNIISRASDDGSDTKLKIAGADNVIMPDKVGGAHMASLVMKPDVMEFIDQITIQGGDNINLEEISFERDTPALMNKSLKELDIRNKTGANIIGFKTAGGEYLVNPGGDTIITPHSKVFVLGTNEQLKKLKTLLKQFEN